MDIYPKDFEQKIGFSDIKELLLSFCSNSISFDYVSKIKISDEYSVIYSLLQEVRELMDMISKSIDIPSMTFEDIRPKLKTLNIEGTFLEETDLAELNNFLSIYHYLHKVLTKDNTTGDLTKENFRYIYPHLAKHFEKLDVFPNLKSRIENILAEDGSIKDDATSELRKIRYQLRDAKVEVSNVVQNTFAYAQKQGWIEGDANPSIRNGRIVFPVVAMYKKALKGIVHDESATGKTMFIEPVAVLEANNKVRELEMQERREIVSILKKISETIRINARHIIPSYDAVGYIDMVRAKCSLARELNAICPILNENSTLEYYSARHPLLERSLSHNNKNIVPLDINIDDEKQKIIIISGPNAGGKSVCLKTLGLLQYMVQSGLPIPVSDNSRAGVFSSIFIDIGDDQNIENDLSTYSSHLKNMCYFLKKSDKDSLILIDEFGSGTDPFIGGALATSILEEFHKIGLKGIITTHYQPIKDFANENYGVINAAMLYDRHNMTPLFKLSVGRPGSSFAIEIARKIGLASYIIDRASDMVGQDYINQDKYLQDIVRDKRYWEKMRAEIKNEKRHIEDMKNAYNDKMTNLKTDKKTIIENAKKEAESIIAGANKIIEQTIKDIKEAQAEKEKTILKRKELESFKESLKSDSDKENRKTRKQKGNKTQISSVKEKYIPQEGDFVKVEGYTSVGVIKSLKGNKASVEIGHITMNINTDRLVKTTEKEKNKNNNKSNNFIIDSIHEKRLTFSQSLDIRGYRAVDAMEAVSEYIDKAIQLSIPVVKILHGTGSGALRATVRDYLSKFSDVKDFYDEDVRFGGAGITVVELR